AVVAVRVPDQGRDQQRHLHHQAVHGASLLDRAAVYRIPVPTQRIAKKQGATAHCDEIFAPRPIAEGLGAARRRANRSNASRLVVTHSEDFMSLYVTSCS